MTKEQFIKGDDIYSKIPMVGCWLMGVGDKNPKNYPYVSIDGERWIAHRYSYHIFKGAIPEDMMVCHTCDTPQCVNPDHLFLGTNSGNQKDSVRKGRDNPQHGEDHGMHKLNLSQVNEIRRMLTTTYFKQHEIAEIFGVGQNTISRIKTGTRWGKDV